MTSYPPPAGSPYANPYQPNGPSGFPARPLPTVKSIKAPAILLTVGVVLCVIALVTVVIAVARLEDATNSMSEIARDGASTTTLEAGTSYGLYSNGSVTCDVTGPDGSAVTEEPPATGSTTTLNKKELFASFTPTMSGDHTITCSSQDYFPVYIAKNISTSSIAGGVIATILATFAGMIGLPMFIGGLIWLLVRRSGNKRAISMQAVAGVAGPHWPGA